MILKSKHQGERKVTTNLLFRIILQGIQIDTSDGFFLRCQLIRELGHQGTQGTYIFASSVDQNMPRIPLEERKADEDPVALALAVSQGQDDTCPHTVLALLCTKLGDML